MQAHERLGGEFADLFRSRGITPAQFNVLRILVRAPKGGVPCSRITEELIHRLPDVTRLLDRMERDGLVTRRRCDEDRRVVKVEISAKGRKTCEGLYDAVSELHERQFAHLSARDVTALAALLAKAWRTREATERTAHRPRRCARPHICSNEERHHQDPP
ncbi:MAG: MarR family transcriptional regulator [Planctomycetota bacterium]